MGTLRPMFYAGSLERIDFGEEGEEKGFLLVDVEPQKARTTFCPWPARPFLTIEVTVKGDQPTEQVLAALAAQPIDQAVLRVIVKGSAEQLQQLRMAELVTAAGGASFVAGLQRLTAEEARARRSEGQAQRVE